MSKRATLKRVQEIATLAGLKGRINEEMKTFEMGFQLDGDRTQLVLVRDTSSKDRKMITIFSPCVILKRGLIERLTREMAVELLTANENLHFARYGIWQTEKQTMVVASYDHLLETLDPAELGSTAWAVAIAADMYERKHGQDTF